MAFQSADEDAGGRPAVEAPNRGSVARRAPLSGSAARRQPLDEDWSAEDEGYPEDSPEYWGHVAVFDPDPDNRIDAVREIGSFDLETARGLLASVLSDYDPEVRLEGLSELMTVADEPPLDLLAPMLDDPDPEVRLEVVRMIADSDHADADWLLRGALGDTNGDVREEAADALDVELEDDDEDDDIES